MHKVVSTWEVHVHVGLASRTSPRHTRLHSTTLQRRTLPEVYALPSHTAPPFALAHYARYIVISARGFPRVRVRNRFAARVEQERVR